MSSVNVVELLDGLLSHPSENPPGDERAIAAYVTDVLRSWSLPVEIVAGAEHRPNVIARAYAGPGPRLILQGHIDTKPAHHAASGAAQWSVDPFRPTHKDGLIYGLGACDTKAGVAAQMVALHELLTSGRPWRGEVVFQGVADEENGSRLGAELLLERGLLAADAALVAEPTDLSITTAQLGNAWAEVVVTGRAAHAGTPWRGVDAVDHALDYIQRVKRALTARPVDARFPGHPRLNVGKIMGGNHPGTVPGECRMLFDVRVRPGETQEEYFDLYRRCARECSQETGVAIDVTLYLGGGCASNQVSHEEKWVQNLAQAWTACEGSPAPLGVFYGGSDARFFARAGVPVVVFGPGKLEHAHSIDEHVIEQDVVRGARFLTDALRRYFT